MRPPALYRLALYYCPFMAVTRPCFWPVSSIEAEPADTLGSMAFAGIDFCSGYWQRLVHLDSQPLFTFSTRTGVEMPTHMIQSGCSSAASSQRGVG